MKKVYTFLFLLAITLSSFSLVEASGGQIRWFTNYKEAVAQSQSTGKPLLLFFTGSDWCSWCKKLDSEVFQTQEFADLAGDKFIFVEIDFPHSSRQPPELEKQNAALQQKFQPRGYPAVIILDSNQRQIGSTGYQAGGPRAYAEHLSKFAGSGALR